MSLDPPARPAQALARTGAPTRRAQARPDLGTIAARSQSERRPKERPTPQPPTPHPRSGAPPRPFGAAGRANGGLVPPELGRTRARMPGAAPRLPPSEPAHMSARPEQRRRRPRRTAHAARTAIERGAPGVQTPGSPTRDCVCNFPTHRLARGIHADQRPSTEHSSEIRAGCAAREVLRHVFADLCVGL